MREALREAMHHDDKVVLMGGDVGTADASASVMGLLEE
jgi:pyruvate/2-oxoglutarate/acetoin dehydrogenase E1 component